MAQFMLVVLGIEEFGVPNDPDPFAVCKSLIPCQDLRQVEIAIGVFRATLKQETADGLVDWNIFELEGTTYKKRAITFKPDGRSILKIS